MGEIGPRLVQRGDGEMDRRRALAQSGDLREDEPHPVALLASGAKLFAGLRIGTLLRVDEPLQVERVGHDLFVSPQARAAYADFG